MLIAPLLGSPWFLFIASAVVAYWLVFLGISEVVDRLN
jgi:hypothetical protein